MTKTTEKKTIQEAVTNRIIANGTGKNGNTLYKRNTINAGCFDTKEKYLGYRDMFLRLETRLIPMANMEVIGKKEMQGAIDAMQYVAKVLCVNSGLPEITITNIHVMEAIRYLSSISIKTGDFKAIAKSLGAFKTQAEDIIIRATQGINRLEVAEPESLNNEKIKLINRALAEKRAKAEVAYIESHDDEAEKKEAEKELKVIRKMNKKAGVNYYGLKVA